MVFSSGTEKLRLKAKLKLQIIASFLFSLVLCTELYSQTTQEEYNYVTKGYKDQIEKGGDMKKGYRFVDITESSFATGSSVQRKCNFKALFKEGKNKPCAILCIYTRSDNGFTDYLCIPTHDAQKEIWDQTFQKINSYSETGANALIWGMAKLASYYGTK